MSFVCSDGFYHIYLLFLFDSQRGCGGPPEANEGCRLQPRERPHHAASRGRRPDVPTARRRRAVSSRLTAAFQTAHCEARQALASAHRRKSRAAKPYRGFSGWASYLFPVVFSCSRKVISKSCSLRSLLDPADVHRWLAMITLPEL